MIKATVLAGVLALALTIVAASPVAAAVHIESCMKGTEECKTASVGTTFETSSKKFVVESEEEVVNECEVTTNNEITDSTSEKAKDPIAFTTTKNIFSNCTEGSVEAENLPWTWESDQPTFEETQMGERNGYALTDRGCTYGLWNPNHLVLEKWLNNNPSESEDYGKLLYLVGESCYWLIRVYNVLIVKSVNDPNLAGAKNIVIK